MEQLDFNLALQKPLTYQKEVSQINQIKQKYQQQGPASSFKQLYSNKSLDQQTINPAHLNKKQKKLYQNCLEMESLLWKQVLNSMKKTINKYQLIDGGQGEKIFSDFLYDEYSKMMAKNSNSKISDTLYKQLSRSI